MSQLKERYQSFVVGEVSCFDRVVINGTLTEICHKAAMAQYLLSRKERILDLPRVFEPMKAEIVANAKAIATAHGLKIEYIARRNFRKEKRIREILAERGDEPGLVHVFSAVEGVNTFRAGVRRDTGRPFIAPKQGKCLHYYFYFIDSDFGLCYLRVPTWAPYRLQFYFNGHNWLARRLSEEGIDYTLIDNAFVSIADFDRAQEIADEFPVRALHTRLDDLARLLCPAIRHFHSGYHWSLMQVEYATDLIFTSVEALAPLYDHLVRTAAHAVKVDQIATFLGRRLDARFAGEIGNRFHTRIEGTSIKHFMGRASIKMYDKLGRVLRIETTVNDVTIFKHHRMVEHRDGTQSMKTAPVKKKIYSLGIMAELMAAANRRYLEFLAALDDPSDGARKLPKVAKTVRRDGRSHRGFNLFQTDDLAVFLAIARGEFAITGFRNRDMRRHLGKTSQQVSRILKRLRLHGLIKIVGKRYKYYLTRIGRSVVSCALQLRENLVIPALAAPTS
jgi:hypothetical protein